MSSKPIPPGRSQLECFPSELLTAIFSYLANKDIKTLRLASKPLKERALLRIERVFLFANPRNIEVFRAIASNEEFRHSIKEIVWDDVQLPGLDAFHHPREQDAMFYDLDPSRVEGVPDWFVMACEKSHGPLKMFKGRQIDDLPLSESWEYYKQLLQQQDDVISSGADIEAFRYGLDRFAKVLEKSHFDNCQPWNSR